MDSPWIQRLAPRNNPKLRLICFPQAGRGSSMFRAWSKDLPETVEVCAVAAPGREGRYREPSITSMSALVTKLVDGLAPAMNERYAFFGHSLGALVAFALTRELRRQGKALPAHLCVAGRRAPQWPPSSPIYQLGDREFLANLTNRYGALPAEVVADPEVLSLFLSPLRGDMTILDTYSYDAEPPLPVPLSAYGSTRDATLTPAMLEAWKQQTSHGFRSRMFDGDHFFPDALRPQLLAAIRGDLGDLI
jgi:surfactin synthase thioesterase subunit